MSVQRATPGGWRTVDDDLGLRILWRIDDDRPQELGIPVLDARRRGTYRAWWEPPRDAAAGAYRFVVTARRYRLVSRAFARARRALAASRQAAGPTGPSGPRAPLPGAGARTRPHDPSRPGARRPVGLVVGGRRTVRALGEGGVLLVRPRGASVRIPAGAARDRFGNVNGEPFLQR